MNLSVFIVLVLLGNVLISSSISFFSFKPILEGWYSMKISKSEIEIEKRRLFSILTINAIAIYFNLHTYNNFSWLLFILVCILSLAIFFLTSKMNYQKFHKLFTKNRTEKESKEKTKIKITQLFVIIKKDVSEKEKYLQKNNTSIKENNPVTSKKKRTQKHLENEKEKNIQIVFTKNIYNLLRKYDFLYLEDDFNYEKTKDLMINSEEKIFRFKNYFEAKEFYKRVFEHTESKIKSYNKMLGFSVRSLNEAPKSEKFSEDFKSFLKELEK